MTLENIIKIAKAYQDMGDAVQSQLDQMIAGDLNDINPNAWHMATDWLNELANTELVPNYLEEEALAICCDTEEALIAKGVL